jgi:imidazolonepropionase-like amidohydrolase
MRGLAVALALGLSAVALAQEEPVVVLQGGTVLPIAGSPIEGGMVVMQGGTIRFVGRPDDVNVDVRASHVTVIDATGKIVMPGLVDAYTQLGLVEIGMVAATRDMDEAVAPMTPHVHTMDGLNVGSSLYRVARLSGITSALSAPAEGNLVSGRSCLLALDGDLVETLVRKPFAALHVSLGSPPMQRYGDKKQAPSTRMGELAMLRGALIKAREYADKRVRFEAKRQKAMEDGEDEPNPVETDLELEAWLPVLRGATPLIVRAQRASDIEAALRLGKEFGVTPVILRGAESWKVADRIAAAGASVLLGPVTTQPSSVETLGARPDCAALLHAAGVRFGIVSASAHNVRNLPYEAGIAVANALPMDVALRAVTLGPAEILGVADRIGSLAAGKDADVILLDGDVIQPRTKVERMWIRGQEVELTSRQTELAEQHR